ncbi:tail fiber protein [Dickeya phage DchS19]|uniref:Tail fiber protein n=1 Tax=Dickeya phage DchS19 TaxID=2951194 RepID=A0A9E7LVQ2_9CAUD|nr:tail fiber protein [Dickeya phage DchS19]
MANTIKTVMTYPLNGSTVDFNIPFEYLARKFVTITLIGTDRNVLVLNQDYRFSTKTTITLTKAWGPADGYDTIEVRRYTSATDRLVDFADGSILRAYDLNIAQVQTLHVAEEARDLTADTIGVNNDGNLDARGRRIVNVADAVDDYDAINLHMMKTWNNSALISANAAAASQVAAKTSETNAATSERNSKTSETNSKTSENNAYQWAQRAEDSPVQGSEFSSYHYSRKSAKSAAAASVSEGNAAVSERNAKTSENNAKTSETAAAASAQTAKDEATKLGNMNDLAAAIDSVDTTTNRVTFKGDVVAGGAVWFAYSGSVDLSWYTTDGKTLKFGKSTKYPQAYLDITAAQMAYVSDISSTVFRIRDNVFSPNLEANFGFNGTQFVLNKTPSVTSFSLGGVPLWNVGEYRGLNNMSTRGGFDAYATTGSIINQGAPTLSSKLRDGGVPSGRVRANFDFWARGDSDGQRQGVIRVHGDDMSGEQNWLFRGAGNYAGRIEGSAGRVAIDTSSDRKLKDIKGDLDMQAAYDRVKAIRMVEYTWNDHEFNIQRGVSRSEVQRGVIAQEMNDIDSHYVTSYEQQLGGLNEGRSETIMNLNETSMLMDALATIKVLQSRIEALESKG